MNYPETLQILCAIQMQRGLRHPSQQRLLPASWTTGSSQTGSRSKDPVAQSNDDDGAKNLSASFSCKAVSMTQIFMNI